MNMSLYINGSELKRPFSVERATTKFIDKARIKLKPDDEVSIGDEVEIYVDGEKVFGGYVRRITQNPVKEAEVLGYGEELDLKGISKVWYDKSPEEIVQELVDDTSLTYSSTATSGITLSKYVAQDKRYSEIVNEMAKLLDWQVRVEPDKKFYFEPRGHETSPVSIQISRSEWHRDTSKLMNKITLVGGKATYSKEDSFTGDGSTKEFTLTYRPVGNVRVLVDGTEKTPVSASGGDYSVDAESKKITFESAPADGSEIKVQYSYEVPIRVSLSNPSSMERYGTFFRKVEAKWLRSFQDARKYARKLLSLYSEPFYHGNLTVRFDPSIKPGQKVTINDTVNNVSGEFVVQRVKMTHKGRMDIVVGEEVYDEYEWRQEVEDRIKQLEQTLSATDFVSDYLFFQEKTKAKVKISRFTLKYREVLGGLIWDHETYGKWDDGQWGEIHSLICDHDQYGKVEYQNENEANVLEKGYSEWKTHYEVTR